MKKTIMPIVLTGIISISLVGCGQNQAQPSTPNQAAEQFKAQLNKAQQEQANQKQALDDMFKHAKINGNRYTFTNTSNYTFQSIQLHWTEFNKDGSQTFSSYSVSKEVNNIKPHDTFTLEAYLSQGTSMKVTHLDGFVQN